MPTIEYDEETGLIWADDRWMTLDLSLIHI